MRPLHPLQVSSNSEEHLNYETFVSNIYRACVSKQFQESIVHKFKQRNEIKNSKEDIYINTNTDKHKSKENLSVYINIWQSQFQNKKYYIFIKNKEGYFIMIKELIHQENIRVVRAYVPNNRARKYIKQIW